LVEGETGEDRSSFLIGESRGKKRVVGEKGMNTKKRKKLARKLGGLLGSIGCGRKKKRGTVIARKKRRRRSKKGGGKSKRRGTKGKVWRWFRRKGRTGRSRHETKKEAK